MAFQEYDGGMRRPPDSSLRCSFCNQNQATVGKLISSPSDRSRAYICDECINVCNLILEDDRENAPPEKPQPLKEYLDQEVTGPASVRKKLSLVISEQAVDWPGKILLMGPATRLKTRLARMLAQILHVPYAIVETAPKQ